jgi:hypothetical protein
LVNRKLTGINNAGDIVGYQFNFAPFQAHGFLLHDGQLTRIDVPGAIVTLISGINNRGEIVGGYLDANFSGHTFLGTPIHAAAGL